MKNPLLKRKYIRKITVFLNSEMGLKYVPYGIGSRYISWFCNTDFAINKFFQNKSPIIEEFLENFPNKYDNRKVISGFFNMNYLHGWRASSISHMRNLTFKRRVKISGLEAFKKRYDEGKGVILLGSHIGLPAVSLSMFPRLGYKNFYSIMWEKGAESIKFKGVKDSRKPKILAFKRDRESEAFAQLFETKDLLEKGNIVHLLGDGSHGRSSHNLEFLGKLQGFRATFAELSLLTGSPVFPIFITPEKGKVNVEICKPIDPGNEDMDRDERVSQMLKQYARILENKWVENPQYVNGGFMQMYNRQIRV